VAWLEQRYSSAQVTSQQLAASVDQGLASAEDSESFEAVQTRLMAKVQEEMAAAKAVRGKCDPRERREGVREGGWRRE